MEILRPILTIAGILAVVGAVLLVMCGAPFPSVIWLAVLGIVILLGVVFERAHYKALSADSPGEGFEPTPERFVDPETGKLVQVHVNPATGERAYVVVETPSGG
jgi:hypothetical protein